MARRSRVFGLLFCSVAIYLFISGCVSTRQANRTLKQPRHHDTSTTSKSASFDSFVFSEAPSRTTYPNEWVVLKNSGYESAYDEKFKNPVWVAYHIAAPKQYHPKARPSGYTTDIRTTSPLSQTDYPSGYDHGHMACNETMGEFFGDAAQADSFLMTNMVPQRHGLNAGPWKTVETEERTDWVTNYREIWVFAGPVYTATDSEPIAPVNEFDLWRVCILLKLRN